MMTRTPLCCALLAALWASAAAGQDPKQAQLDQNHELEKQALALNEKLGTKLAVSIDWKSFEATEDWKSHSLSSYCAAPLEALENLNKGASTLAYIRKNLDRVTCRFGGPGKRSLAFQGKTLTWTVDFKAPNNEEYARAEILRRF